MTRKHFNAIAEALRTSFIEDYVEEDVDAWAAEYQRTACCRAVATALSQFNPNFNRSRFLEACGVSEKE